MNGLQLLDKKYKHFYHNISPLKFKTKIILSPIEFLVITMHTVFFIIYHLLYKYLLTAYYARN
jgi:hypothetical protein